MDKLDHLMAEKKMKIIKTAKRGKSLQKIYIFKKTNIEDRGDQLFFSTCHLAPLLGPNFSSPWKIFPSPVKSLRTIIPNTAEG
jgi:hypothetical protein